MANLPFFTVVTPVFNGRAFLRETIESVQAQTFEDWEYVLVDNASPDDSAAIVREYSERDGRIHLLQNKTKIHSGPSSNRAIRLAQGQWILRLDQDDLFKPHYLRTLHRQIVQLEEKDRAAFFLSTWADIIDEFGTGILRFRLPASDFIKRMMQHENLLFHSATSFSKSLWNKVGGYPEPQKENDDVSLWKKFFGMGIHLTIVPEHLVCYRLHYSNLSIAPAAGQTQTATHAQRKNVEWKISLFLKQGRLKEARKEIKKWNVSIDRFVKSVFYFLATFLSPKLVQYFMWHIRPRLRHPASAR